MDRLEQLRKAWSEAEGNLMRAMGRCQVAVTYEQRQAQAQVKAAHEAYMKARYGEDWKGAALIPNLQPGVVESCASNARR